MNHLQHETSPYLLQHADNPVEWYPWKEEALARARRENKPILVSIGYSTCHWCHVMERESFEDREVADYMNENFINIKIDREERPDLDQIYMDACQAITGSGGWPLNCFLTPDGRPFMAGTYYPPVPRHNRPSWLQVLMHIARVFRDERQKVEDQAQRLTEMIQRSNQVFFSSELDMQAPESPFSEKLIDNLWENLGQRFDREEGGFGGAPKFPPSMSLDWMLQYYHQRKDPAALDHLVFTLQKMIYGGIYDQLGGGFARYATDRAWKVPHFEKMLYDNAQLIGVLADTYRVKADPLFLQTIRETVDFLKREMKHPSGAFYSALDADSEGEEGRFYVWTYEELQTYLGEDADLFCAYYQCTREGNWEGKNILWRTAPARDFARQQDLEPAVWLDKLQGMQAKLLQVRAQRVRPGLDDKVLLSWNAMLVTNLVKAYQATGEQEYADLARTNIRFLWERFSRKEPGFFHTGKFNGEEWEVQYDAFLEDYAYLMEAMLAVYGLDFDVDWIRKAADVCEFVFEQFFDEDSGLFYFTSADQDDIPIRKTEVFDSAIPSANSTMMINLLQLSLLQDRPDWRTVAEGMARKMLAGLQKYPGSFANWARGVLHLVYPPKEIAIIGSEANTYARALQRSGQQHYLLMASPQEQDAFPLLAHKAPGKDGSTLIYICENFVCESPVNSVDQALERLAN